jgi:hypothetical protein
MQLESKAKEHLPLNYELLTQQINTSIHQELFTFLDNCTDFGVSETENGAHFKNLIGKS